MISARRLARLIADAGIFAYADEYDLQTAVAIAITAAGLPVQREVRLTKHDRIDLLVGRVGVEVKVKGQPMAIHAQLRRYALSGKVDQLVLVSTSPRHSQGLLGAIEGIPVSFCYLRAL